MRFPKHLWLGSQVSALSVLVILGLSCSGSPGATVPATSTGGSATAGGGINGAGGAVVSGGIGASGGAVATGGSESSGAAGPNLALPPDGYASCVPVALSNNGVPIVAGKSWEMTNEGGSGTIDIAATVSGEPTTTTTQFSVESGARYWVTICVPVNASLAAACTPLGCEGLNIAVTFPGSASNAVSFLASSNGYNFHSATGAPWIGLALDTDSSACGSCTKGDAGQ